MLRNIWHVLCVIRLKSTTMPNRSSNYMRKEKARKVMESPLSFDLKTLLSASLALTRSHIVRNHVSTTLNVLNGAK